jgi:glycosyltransferase involved in cell wall biosynthesis
LMSARNIAIGDFSVLSVPASLVPSYLSAADAGLSFIKPCISKIASSPTKNAEYLACGLPLIINAGIGDSDALVNDWNTGALLEEFTEEEYERIGKVIRTMAAGPDARNKARTHARAIARQLFDLETIGAERYAALYERVY